MKLLLPIAFASLFVLVQVASAQGTTPPASGAPTIVLSTPAGILNGKGIILGTATGGTATTTTGEGTPTTTTRTGNVANVFYQYDGERIWRKARLSPRNSPSTTFMVDVNITSRAKGRRISFYTKSNLGSESDLVGRRFKRTN